MAAHVVEEVVAPPEDAAEGESDDNRPLVFGNVRRAPRHIRQAFMQPSSQGRRFLLPADHFADGLDARKNRLYAPGRFGNKDRQTQIAHTRHKFLRHAVRREHKVGMLCEHALGTLVVQLDRYGFRRLCHARKPRIIHVGGKRRNLFGRREREQDFIRTEIERHNALRLFVQHDLRPHIIDAAEKLARFLFCRHSSSRTGAEEETRGKKKQQSTAAPHDVRTYAHRSGGSSAADRGCHSGSSSFPCPRDCKRRASRYRSFPPYR